MKSGSQDPSCPVSVGRTALAPLYVTSQLVPISILVAALPRLPHGLLTLHFLPW